MGLTPKQDAFSMGFVETGNASQAYRDAYNAENMKPESVNRKAKELLDNGKIAARVAELRAEHAERHAITVESLLAELEEARQIALAATIPQSSAAVSASLGKAKLLGLVTDKLDARMTNGQLPGAVVVDDLA